MFKQGMVCLAWAALAVVTLGGTSVCHAQAPIDPKLPVYRPSAEKLTGTLKFVGSDTMSQVASVWAEGFKRFHPDVKIEIKVENSQAAVEEVAAGTASFGLLSREIQKSEVTAFEKKAGHGPKILTPCLEALAIFVHKDNPLQGLTLAQVDAIFSSSLKRGAKEGHTESIRTWGDLGVKGELASKEIKVIIRGEETGPQDYFKMMVMHGGEFRESAHKLDSNLELVKGIAADKTAIGFADSIYELPGIKATPIALEAHHPFASIESVGSDGAGYPLVRPLQLVVNQPADAHLTALQGEFLKYVFSQIGQEDVVKVGFAPITARPAQVALGSVGLNTLK